MTTATGDIAELRNIVRVLQPSGPEGFEGLLAAVLTDVMKMTFALAKSGSQHGRDGDSFDRAVKFEAKRYDERVSKQEVLSKLAEIALNDRGDTDLWILGSTAPVAAQDIDAAINLGRRFGIGVLFFDWPSTSLPSLAVLLALAPDTAAHFLSQKLGRDEAALRARISAVEGHPQFAGRSGEILRSLSEPSLAPAYARIENQRWLREAFESSARARALFGQPLAPGDPLPTHVLDRPVLRSSLANYLSAPPNGAIAAILGVDGSGKSWLFAQTWLAMPADTLVFVLRPNDLEASSRESLEELLISKCILQTAESPTEIVKERWRRCFKIWRASTNTPRPLLTVFVDGINERNSLRWDEILDTFNGLVTDLQGKLVVSCRIAFFSGRLERRLFSPVERIIVPEWSEQELTMLLSAKGIKRGNLNDAVARSLKNPRVFSVASRLLDSRQIERAEELSVSRLLFEHMLSNDSGVTVPPPQFVRHVKDHADQVIQRLRERGKKDLMVFDALAASRPSNEAWPIQFDAVSAGRFFVPVQGEPTLYQVKDEGLPLALGLSLLSAARSAERNSVDPGEELSRILDPIGALDQTFDILFAAVVAAVVDPDCPDAIAAALIEALVGLQNANQDRYPEFRALAKGRPRPFFMALESGTLTQRHTANFEWLVEALADVAWDRACVETTAAYIHSWLNLFSASPFRQVPPFGLTKEKFAEEVEKKRSDIEGRLAALSPAEREILGELVWEERDYSRLSTFIFQMLAGRPLAPFARSLRNWKLADVLNPGFADSDDCGHLFRLKADSGSDRSRTAFR